MVVSKDGGQAQRFLAVDVYQMSLVEPETKRLGWGVVKFAGLLQVREKCCDHVCVAVLCAKNVQSLKSMNSFFYTFLCLSSSRTHAHALFFFYFLSLLLATIHPGFTVSYSLRWCLVFLCAIPCFSLS